jgi:hypothetical protein
MSLIDVFSSGYIGYTEKKESVTATDHATQGGYISYTSYTENITPKQEINDSIPAMTYLIKCGDCQHFNCFNRHGRGSGICQAGAGDRLWSESLRECIKFESK